MTHWFTSDLHLGHENVALVHRGARSVEQHDQAIVSNLLRCLQSGDDLYILGDLSLGRKRDVDHAVTLLEPVSRRVGYKHMHLIRGNHDPKAKWATLRLAEVFSTIADTMVLQVADMPPLILSHYPSTQVANTVARTGVPAGCSSNASTRRCSTETPSPATRRTSSSTATPTTKRPPAPNGDASTPTSE